MSEEKKSFTVADRRRFTADGELRDAEPPAQREDEGGRVAQPGPPPAGRPQARRLPDPASAGEAADFAGFLLSLAAQASLLLGLGPEGETHPPDLAGARSLIAVLEMLEDKTDGRRTPEEDEVLEGILYELRMAYVTKSRSGA